MVTLLTKITDPDPRVPSEVEVDVRMCEVHARRLRVGGRTGRSKVVRKTAL